MKLPRPPQTYDPVNEGQTRAALELADGKNVKTDGVLTKLQFRDSVTGMIKIITVVSGVLTVT